MTPARNLFDRLKTEYSRGGLKHVIVGTLEWSMISLLRIHPSIYWRFAPQYFRWRCSNDVHEYRYPPNPFKAELVDPDAIIRRTGRTGKIHLNRRTQFGTVRGGNWDKGGKQIKEKSVYRAARQHFLNGAPWEETETVQRRLERFERGEYDEYDSRTEILEKFHKLDDLYHRIQEEGYRSQRELLAESGGTNDGLYLDTLDEVTVDVGRNGELLHVDGIHRLVVAKLLDLDEIPVVFLVRHREWMEYRDELAESESDVPDHPDLRDLGRR